MVYEDEEPDIHDPNYDESYQVRPLGGLSFNTFNICFQMLASSSQGAFVCVFFPSSSQCIGWHPLSLYVHVLILNC